MCLSHNVFRDYNGLARFWGAVEPKATSESVFGLSAKLSYFRRLGNARVLSVARLTIMTRPAQKGVGLSQISAILPNGKTG